MQSSWTVLVPNTLVVFRHAKFGLLKNQDQPHAKQLRYCSGPGAPIAMLSIAITVNIRLRPCPKLRINRM